MTAPDSPHGRGQRLTVSSGATGPRNTTPPKADWDVESATFTDGAGTTMTVDGGTIRFHELPGFDLAPGEREVPKAYTVTFKEGPLSCPAEPKPPRGMNRAQRRKHNRSAGGGR